MNSRGYDIRLAMPEDVAVLPEVERLAGRLFKTYPGDLGIPEEMYEHPNSVETFAAAQKARTSLGGHRLRWGARRICFGHGNRGLRPPRRTRCTPFAWRPRDRFSALSPQCALRRKTRAIPGSRSGRSGMSRGTRRSIRAGVSVSSTVRHCRRLTWGLRRRKDDAGCVRIFG